MLDIKMLKIAVDDIKLKIEMFFITKIFSTYIHVLPQVITEPTFSI